MALTQAQENAQALAVESVVHSLKDILDEDFLTAIEAALEARGHINPLELEAFAQRMSGRAWDMQRESRYLG